MKVREKIKFRMDVLQGWMETNYHLKHPTEVYQHTLSVSKFWSVMSEEDKDYLQCAQEAIIEGEKWIV